MSNDFQPHGIFADYTQGGKFNPSLAQLAYVTDADPKVAEDLLARAMDGDGRSPFRWVRLYDGTLMLAVFPRGDTYMELSDGGVCDWEDTLQSSGEDTSDFESRDDIRVEGATFAVTLEYIGEGNDGDYDPSDPEDQPLYRYSAQRRVDGEWEDIPDGSYCTQVPANCSLSAAQRVANYLLNELEMNGDAGLKRFCERLSWTSLETVLPLAA